MPTDFATEYQALRHKVAQEVIRLEEKAKGSEEYLNGQALYQQRAYQHRDLNLQNDFNRVQGLIAPARHGLLQVTLAQDHEQDFVDATNTFLSEAGQVATKGKEACLQSFRQKTRRGIVVAFWQDILAQLEDTEEPESMLNHLGTVRQHLEDVSNMYHDAYIINHYNDLCEVTDPDNVNSTINDVLNEKPNARETLLRIFSRSGQELATVSANANLSTAKVSEYIRECDDGFFYTIQEDLEELYKNMQSLPTRSNVHLEPSGQVETSTVAAPPHGEF